MKQWGCWAKNFPKLSLLLRGMKGNIFGWFFCFFFPTLKVPTENEIMIEQKKLQLTEMNLLNGNLQN